MFLKTSEESLKKWSVFEKLYKMCQDIKNLNYNESIGEVSLNKRFV